MRAVFTKYLMMFNNTRANPLPPPRPPAPILLCRSWYLVLVVLLTGDSLVNLSFNNWTLVKWLLATDQPGLLSWRGEERRGCVILLYFISSVILSAMTVRSEGSAMFDLTTPPSW